MPSSSSSPSPAADATPPTRPVPVPPSDAPDAAQAQPSPPSGGMTTPVDAEAEIDASTLRFLASSFRALFLPWLFRLAVFTACAKLIRFSSRYLFAAVRYCAAYLWSALGWLVSVLARVALWGGLVATAAWCLAGLVGFGAYWLLRARPGWNRYKHERPVRARYAKRAGAYALAWTAMRFVLRSRTWATRLSVLAILAVEAYTFTQQHGPPPTVHAVPSSSSASPASTAPSPARAPPPAGTSVGEEEGVDEDLADRWARQVREEMLRESLLAQGKKRSHPASTGATSAAAAAATTTTTTTATPSESTAGEAPEQTSI